MQVKCHIIWRRFNAKFKWKILDVEWKAHLTPQSKRIIYTFSNAWERTNPNLELFCHRVRYYCRKRRLYFVKLMCRSSPTKCLKNQIFLVTDYNMCNCNQRFLDTNVRHITVTFGWLFTSDVISLTLTKKCCIHGCYLTITAGIVLFFRE